MSEENDKLITGQMSISNTNETLSEIDIGVLPKDVLFGNVMYDAGGTYGPRIQEHLQFVFISSGEATIYIDGNKQYLEQGEVAFLKQGHEEYFEFAKTVKTYHSWCDFYWDLPENVVRLVEELPFKVASSSRIERLIDLGFSLQHDPQALLPSLAHIAATIFWEYIGVSGLAAPSTQNAHIPEPVKRVQAYVRQNYHRDINLKLLSEVAFVTPEHLSRLFRKHTGTTPIRHLQSVRVRQGISFLSHTGITVEKIAFNCGFKTAAHFSRSIKQHTGQTPTEIRRS
ncbi:MAG: AraC family transcriptional regulator [Deinococcota bacterium]